MDYAIAANYVVSLDKCLQNMGVSNFLEGLDYDRETLGNPDAFISAEEFSRLVHRAIDLSACPHLGLVFGESLTIVTHGLLGYAAMSSPTMGDAIQTMLHYINTRTNLLSMALDNAGEKFSVELKVLFDDSELVRFIVEMGTVHLSKMRQFLIDANDSCPLIELAYPAPPYAEKYPDFLGGDIQFAADQNRVWFWRRELDFPVSFADDASYQLARDQLKTAAEQLALKQDLASRVKMILFRQDMQHSSMEDIAHELCMSSRTLRRHLLRENVSYQDLADDVRHQKAKAYLLNPRMSLSEISFLLGFQDTSNFIKAFKRWAEMTPGEYREQAQKMQ